MFLPLLIALVSAHSAAPARGSSCPAPDSVQIWLSHGKARTVTRCPEASARRHARPVTRDRQGDFDQTPQPVARPGKIFYPLAYGYTTSGWGRSMGSFGSGVSVRALMSFPYRYDQFYRGPRKIWW